MLQAPKYIFEEIANKSKIILNLPPPSVYCLSLSRSCLDIEIVGYQPPLLMVNKFDYSLLPGHTRSDRRNFQTSLTIFPAPYLFVLSGELQQVQVIAKCLHNNMLCRFSSFFQCHTVIKATLFARVHEPHVWMHLCTQLDSVAQVPRRDAVLV